MTKTNNLFRFATSELSQDAFLCWLLSWADIGYAQSNPTLHRLGLDFLQRLANKSGFSLAANNTVEIKTQYKHIDIVCIVNQSHIFLIEDKTDTSEHGDQLKRYLDTLEADYSDEKWKIMPVYIKTGDQSNYVKVVKDGYAIFQRRDILDCLLSNTEALASSDIARDFANNLIELESDFQSFISLPIKNWKAAAWRGFFCELQKELPALKLNWKKVTPQGQAGFWSCYGGFTPIKHHAGQELLELYVQIEERQLRFKIGDFKKNSQRNLLCRKYHDYFRKLLKDEANKNSIELVFTNKTPGTVITVGTFEQDFPATHSDEKLDLKRTIEMIQKAYSLVQQCSQNNPLT